MGIREEDNGMFNNGDKYQGGLDVLRAERFAKKNDLELVYPADNELQLDFDSEEDYKRFLVLFQTFSRHVQVKDYTVRPSRHGLPRRHVTVELVDAVEDPLERICMQACLGSDAMRELLCYLRLRVCLDDKPTLFFERKNNGCPEWDTCETKDCYDCGT